MTTPIKPWIKIGINSSENISPEAQKWLDDLSDKFSKSKILKLAYYDLISHGKSIINSDELFKELNIEH